MLWREIASYAALLRQTHGDPDAAAPALADYAALRGVRWDEPVSEGDGG